MWLLSFLYKNLQQATLKISQYDRNSKDKESLSEMYSFFFHFSTVCAFTEVEGNTVRLCSICILVYFASKVFFCQTRHEDVTNAGNFNIFKGNIPLDTSKIMFFIF